MTHPPTVALIGCGPGGMFFLHALATRRARLEKEGDTDGINKLPVVTCYEKASGPGGVWRSDRRDGETNMYEALWTNGPKEAMEFFDHTYQEHFGCALPVYLPRSSVLSYLLERVTKDNPSIFKGVKFNTAVDSVTHNAELNKFCIKLSDKSESLYDMCIWAAGGNGKPKIPPAIDGVLSAGFKGKLMHSSQTDSNFDQFVRDKNIMIVGDQFSAEDLALQAIKLGVNKIDVVTRAAEGVATETSAWPMDKVRIREEYVPTAVTKDGYGIVLANVQYDFEKGSYVKKSRRITLHNISTVIYCTGYKSNLDMLDKKLRPASIKEEYPMISLGQTARDWKMAHNALYEDLGDVPLSTSIVADGFVRKGLYRGRLISNPSMFFMTEECDVPLLNLDIIAYRTLAQIIGDIPCPSRDKMQEYNTKTLLEAMHDPFFRYECDENYEKQWKSAIDDDHWSNDPSSPGSEAITRNYTSLQFRNLARDATDAGYPVDIGTYEELSEAGKALVEMSVASGHSRYEMDQDSPDASWRTFRDHDPSNFRSIFTGTKAVPLKGRWLELDNCSEITDVVGTLEQPAPFRPESIAADSDFSCKVRTQPLSICRMQTDNKKECRSETNSMLSTQVRGKESREGQEFGG